LGKRLVHLEDRAELSGLITETEAYVGTEDQGSHARAGHTRRNAAMWGSPGHAYVYFTYGMHWMLNVVTEEKGFPAAVLLRGLWPMEGIDTMRARRGGRCLAELTDGPAKLCQALGIEGSFDGADLCRREARLYLERGVEIPTALVTKGPRVGLNNVPEPWRSIDWRFRVRTGILTSLLEG
jgi:DNA-3-methyladenine glycosylase